MNDYKEGFSIHRDGESSARELTAVSGPGKMRGLEKSGGAVQGSQLGESQVQGRGPGLDGLGLRERAREGARSVCRLWACLRFTGSKTFTTFPEGSLTLKVPGPQPRGLPRGRGWLFRKSLGRAPGQTLVCSFPSVNTRKPHPVPQTDLQKSVLSFRLGYSVGAKWLEAQDSLPRFRTPDQCNFQLSFSKIPTPDIPAISHWSHKNMWGQVISGGRKAHLDPPWRSTSKHIPARLFFFFFSFSNTWEIT